jgi:hypothetical protein
MIEPEIVPGLTLCELRCGEPAIAVWDLEHDPQALCLDCLEAVVEREIAVELTPSLREVLPPLRERA